VLALAVGPFADRSLRVPGKSSASK
jgi:hypothetical protein